MTYNNMHGDSATAQDLGARVSNDGGSSYESSNYEYANQMAQQVVVLVKLKVQVEIDLC